MEGSDPDSQIVAPEGMSVVVEHPVIFKMPRLQNDKEREEVILGCLYELKGKFPDLITLSTGRLLKEIDGCTHAIFVRFPSRKALIDYYTSEQLMEVILKMLPSLSGEYTVDYSGFAFNDLVKEHENSVVHITFWKFADEITSEAVEDVMSSLYSLKNEMPSIVLQISAGSNNYLRDKAFSHAFVARLASENTVEGFYSHPAYVKIMEEKIQPHCTRILSADFTPYSPPLAGPRL
ncbi:uncharacterized protein LOC112348969 [Selaginella moellendorffii]|uniref:uncharacterized protein LOC112348969 n=1 Tax=Selaginella moellendorffii TaxID=88036 RepID=UPI000D1CE86E|nr:uncharacterized protein LOC112348969 [Selaginella moellendorffii]|eukprot:XP_024538215.1 uncharacterized protein LOC112348969 [Selaginella moellendorffii]